MQISGLPRLECVIVARKLGRMKHTVHSLTVLSDDSATQTLDPSVAEAGQTRAAPKAAPPSEPAGGSKPAKPRRRRLTLWLGVALIGLLAAGGGAWWMLGRAEPVKAPTTVAVSQGDIEVTVLASGTLEASALVSVGAQVSGIVKSMNVTLGQEVAAGDTVALIDSLDQENAVKSAKASLANMQAQRLAQQAELDQAQKTLDRASAMSTQQLISDSELETAEAALASASAKLAALDAQIQQATITVETAELDLSRTTITAPISGTVVAILVQQGQTVNAQQSAPTLIKIANLDTMLIKAEISEADVTRVAAGQKVYFTILGDPDTRIEATLRSVEPAPSSIEEDSSTDSTSAIYYNGIFEVPNPDHTLRISMTANVTIVLDEATNALLVPVAALGHAGPEGRQMVEVYDAQSGRITPTPVEVGLDDGVSAEIENGLNLGDLVVTSGATALALPAAAGAGGGTLRNALGPMGGGMGGPPPGQ